MFRPPNSEPGAMSMDHMQNTAMNIVELACSVVAMPVEMVLRPRYGTRYFPPTVVFFTAILMLILPLFSSLADTAQNVVFLAARMKQPHAMFGLASLTKFFFLFCAVNQFRLYRRMIHMHLEPNSRFEGPPLPFIHLIPGSASFWRVRIYFEPVIVAFAGSFFSRILIFDAGLANYLYFAAICLAMKNFIGWYRAWEFLRNTMDIAVTGPILSRFVENQATDEVLNSVHLASLPKDIDPALRKATATHIARAVSPFAQILDHENHE
jgi:hypothetical protein